MKTLRFHGHSDDTFGEYGVTNEDHDNSASGKPIVFRVEAEGVGLFVIGQYNAVPEGVWSVGLAPLDEDEPFPNWPVRFSADGYTAVLELDVPDDFKLKHVTGEERA